MAGMFMPASGDLQSMTLLGGVFLAGVSALVSQVGFLFRHRGAIHAPEVSARRPLASAAGLFRSKWWSIGYALAFVAYALHVGALTLVSLSIVQAVLASGLVVMGVIAERFFGFKLARRQWLGMGLSALGLAMLALTGEARTGDHSSDYSVAAMIAFEAPLVAAGIGLIVCYRV